MGGGVEKGRRGGSGGGEWVEEGRSSGVEEGRRRAGGEVEVSIEVSAVGSDQW